MGAVKNTLLEKQEKIRRLLRALQNARDEDIVPIVNELQ